MTRRYTPGLSRVFLVPTSRGVVMQRARARVVTVLLYCTLVRVVTPHTLHPNPSKVYEDLSTYASLGYASVEPAVVYQPVASAVQGCI
eukprot:2428652-Pyramimonas_sp.AAC.1